MNRKQLKQAKELLIRNYSSLTGHFDRVKHRTVSIICLVIVLVFISTCSLNFDAEHWDYGAKTTPVTDYLIVVAMRIFGEWCGDYFWTKASTINK